MAGDKITQKDVIDPKIVETFSQLNKEMEESVKLMAAMTKEAIDLRKAFDPEAIQDVNNSIKTYNDTREKSTKINSDAISNLEKLQQKIKDVNEEEERAKIALQEKRKEIRKNIAAQKDATKESVKLTRELQKEVKTEREAAIQNKVLLKIRKDMNGSTAKGAKEISLINKKIDNNNSLIKKNASSLEKQKIGIGKYKEGVTEALKEQEFFGLSINKVSSALKSGAGIIGAAVAVVAGLGKAYASTGRGANDLANASNRLQSITSQLGNGIADLSGSSGLFDKILRALQQSIAGVASTVQSDWIVSIKETLRELTILEVEQEAQKKSQLNRAEELRQIRDEERNSFEDRKAANEELGKVINEREKETIAFQEKRLAGLTALLAFDEGNIELQKEIKQVEFEIADAREEAQGFRSEQLANDLALSKEYIANELELQRTILEGELQTTNDKFNIRKRLIEITKELELQAAGENEQLINIALEKAINAEQALTQAVIDENTKRYEAGLMALENKGELLEADAELEIEAFDEKLEREIEQWDELATAEIEATNKTVEATLAANEEKKISTQDYINFAANSAQQLSSSLFNFLNQDLENQKNADLKKAQQKGASEAELAKIEKDAAKKKKNIALTEAIINTALGVTSALTGPYPLSIVMAVLAAALGAVEIATISSASFAKGTKDSGSQWLDATVSEKGREKVILADGSSFYTPDKQSKMLLPPHSQVIPNHELQKDLADMQLAGSRKGKIYDQKDDKNHKELIEALKGRDETYINITEGGIKVVAKKGLSMIEYIDRHYRGKK
jgi:hypothetical protein